MTVIVCPHCGTRYQVPVETLGPRGREVSCAHCGKSWQAVPGNAVSPPAPPASDPDQLFDEVAERDLDAAFAAEEQAVAAEAAPLPDVPPAAADQPERPSEETAAVGTSVPKAPGPVDSRIRKKRDRAFARRQMVLSARLPFARIRRLARLATLGLLVALIGAGITLRTEIVRSFPDMAGAYAALGLRVNIVGLEFRDVRTLLTPRGGANAMKVDARISSVAPRTVVVPPVVVTLLDAEGAALYEWSVTPEARDLEPGEAVDFTTQLNSPPAGATRVRLTFSGARAQTETPIAIAVQPKEPAN